MAKCEFCGQEVGFLRKNHKECQDKYDDGKQKIVGIAQNSMYTQTNFAPVGEEVRTIAQNSFIGENELKSLLVTAWENSVERAFEDNVLTQEEENSLGTFQEFFSLSQDELDKQGVYSKLVKGALLRDLLEGVIRQRFNVSGILPFNFQKNEALIWVFQNVQYYEQRTRKQYAGGYSGVSFRVAKGIYYRTGGFRGEPINTQVSVHVDTGNLAVTDKYIYFGGNVKGFKIAYDKIISFTPYSDGIGVQRDASTARPQSFVTGDGWFTYNLLTILAKMKAV
jgi:hypothetical protein